MQVTPMLLGACALASLSGAAAGVSINTTPLMTVTDPLGEVAGRQVSSLPAQTSAPGNGRAPDHYPLETPRGVVPVRDLALYGMLSNRYDTRAYFTPEPAYQTAPIQRARYEPPADLGTAPFQPMQADVIELPTPDLPHVAALNSAAVGSAPAKTGHARTIDVRATLALRD